jgi:hypothetical protein
MGRTRADVIADLNVALLAAGYTMRSASIALGLNHSYLSKFMRKTDHSPDVLPEDVRLALANLLGLDQNILRIGTVSEKVINTNAGFIAHSDRVVTTPSGKRTTDMRLDNLLQEIGRIKERLDRLEGQPEQQLRSERKKSRP